MVHGGPTPKQASLMAGVGSNRATGRRPSVRERGVPNEVVIRGREGGAKRDSCFSTMPTVLSSVPRR